MTRLAREEREFRDFVARASPMLLRTAYLLLHDRDAADDAVQTALLHTFRNWRRARRAPEGYARRVLVNVCRNHWRHQRRHPIHASIDDHEPLAVAGASESDRALTRLAIEDALADLPAQQREVLVLRFLLELSVAETAAALQLPEGTIKSATHRGLRAIRALLEDQPEEVGNAH